MMMSSQTAASKRSVLFCLVVIGLAAISACAASRRRTDQTEEKDASIPSAQHGGASSAAGDGGDSSVDSDGQTETNADDGGASPDQLDGQTAASPDQLDGQTVASPDQLDGQTAASPGQLDGQIEDSDYGPLNLDWSSECEAGCLEKMPEETCGLGTGFDLSGCVSVCQRSLTFADRSCGNCLIGLLIWPPADCGAWECVCMGPEMPPTASRQCEEECATTVVRIHTFENALEAPQSQGQTPDRFRLFDGSAMSAGAIVPTNGRVWVLSRRFSDWLIELDEELEINWDGRDDAAFARQVEALYDISPTIDGELGLIGYRYEQGSVHFLAALGSDRVLALQASLPAEEREVGGPKRMAGLPAGGYALLYGITHPYLRIANADGELSGLAEIPMVDGTFMRVRADDLTVDAAGDIVLAGSLDNAIWVAKLDASLDEQGGLNLSVLWSNRFAGEQDDYQQAANAVATNASGSILVGGVFAVEHPLGPPHFPSVSRIPWAALLDAEGNLIWQWQGPADSMGEINGVALAQSGDAYVVGMEDTAAQAERDGEIPLCAPDGCRVLSVRRFSPAGEVMWSYLHREAGSEGIDVALNQAGVPFVEAYLRGTIRDGVQGRPSGLVAMRFNP